MNYELLYTIALTRVPRLSCAHQRALFDAFGSATAIFENRRDISQALPDATPAMCQALSAMEAQLPRAEAELAFADQKHVRCLRYGTTEFPARLQECPDAPVLLYYCGNTDLNAKRVVSIVGTRKITEYGKDLCRSFLRDLRQLCPDALIVSGLAYGVDIHAHRGALDNGMQTVGVLAHGLDQIYPRIHRDSAVQMVRQGGLLTEYMSGTAIDKMNFVARNRIVAGMADATIVVESAAKGGSLITAEIAKDYNRDVFAFPGRTTDLYSAGCNQLIASNQASLIHSAWDFMNAMGWQTKSQEDALREQHIQRNLFPDLTPEEQRVAEVLGNSAGKGMNLISAESNLPVGHLSGILFSMEMKGVVRMMAGGMYRLQDFASTPLGR